MKKKGSILFLAAGLFCACTSDVLVETPVQPVVEEDVPISFGSVNRGLTRADVTGADGNRRQHCL